MFASGEPLFVSDSPALDCLCRGRASGSSGVLDFDFFDKLLLIFNYSFIAFQHCFLSLLSYLSALISDFQPKAQR
jgi:hypothetical protein